MLQISKGLTSITILFFLSQNYFLIIVYILKIDKLTICKLFEFEKCSEILSTDHFSFDVFLSFSYFINGKTIIVKLKPEVKS